MITQHQVHRVTDTFSYFK